MSQIVWTWRQRLFFPGTGPDLGFAKEIWQEDVTKFETAEAIRSKMRRLGMKADDDSIHYYIVRSILPDVVHAAAGILRATSRIDEGVAVVSNFRIASMEKYADAERKPGIVHPSLEDVWFSIEEQLVWARTLDERLKRAPHARNFAKQGLIPALTHGSCRDEITAARSQLLSREFGEARYLANLGLHFQPLQGGTPSASTEEGGLHLPFPDRVTGPVSHREEFTFDDHRDAIDFAHNLSRSVEIFMNDLLTALENHRPERFRNRS